MRIFIVNLEKDIEKKEKVLSYLNNFNLTAEVIPAVYGKNLSKQDLQDKVYDYPNCALTLGEIGCALSHLNIYRKVIKENIPLALILEDDAFIKKDIRPFLNCLEKIDRTKQANVYLLSYITDYYPLSKRETSQGPLYKMYRGYSAFGYVINKEAAKRLAALQTPLKFEADMWEYFKLLCDINIYAAIPDLIYDNDEQKLNSNLEQERDKLKQKRKEYRKKLILKLFPSFIIKKFIYRTFFHLFAKKTKNLKNYKDNTL